MCDVVFFERKPRQLLSPRMYLLRKCSAKRRLEDGRGGASGALLPGEEEAAVAVCEAGGGIKRQKRWWGGGVRGVWVRRIWPRRPAAAGH